MLCANFNAEKLSAYSSKASFFAIIIMNTMKIIAVNKKATFDYEILDRYEAGLVLYGPEVKSIKTGHISLKNSFIARKDSEFYLINTNIPPYQPAGKIANHNPTRPRKILLKSSEIKHLIGKIAVGGLTLVPLRVYTKKRLIKLEFAVGRGKKQFDKRQSIAKKEFKRKMERVLKSF